MQALGHSSRQKVRIDITSVKITEINEYEDNGIWRYEYKTLWTDERLKWPKNCLKEEKDIPDIVKSELLDDILWSPITYLADLANTKKPTCQNTIKIFQVI